MNLNKNHVDTAVSVTDEQTTVVSIRLSDEVVIALFKETMKGYCPVCGFNKISTARRICDECLEKEQQLLFVYASTPYRKAIEKIIQYLMPDPPVTSCIGASPSVAMTHLGVYTGCMCPVGRSRPGARRALVSLGAWVVKRLSQMLEELEKEKELEEIP